MKTFERYQQSSGFGARAVNIEEFKRSEWLTPPALLKLPENEWPERVNLIFASDEEKIPSSVFMINAEEKKTVIQWEQKACSAENVGLRRTKCLKINEEQVRYLQKRQSTNNSTSNVRSTWRAVRRYNSLYKCWGWLLWPSHCEDWAKKLKAMALSFYICNYESGAFRSGTQVGHIVASMQLWDILHETANWVQSTVRTGQYLLELKERLQSTLLHGTKNGSENI